MRQNVRFNVARSLHSLIFIPGFMYL